MKVFFFLKLQVQFCCQRRNKMKNVTDLSGIEAIDFNKILFERYNEKRKKWKKTVSVLFIYRISNAIEACYFQWTLFEFVWSVFLSLVCLLFLVIYFYIIALLFAKEIEPLQKKDLKWAITLSCRCALLRPSSKRSCFEAGMIHLCFHADTYGWRISVVAVKFVLNFKSFAIFSS